MAWIVLIGAGVLEAVWATALARSRGFRQLLPTVIFIVTLTLSMLGLGYAMSAIPTGTAYAVWVGVGAVLTFSLAVLTRAERAGWPKVLLLSGIIACVVGLKILS